MDTSALSNIASAAEHYAPRAAPAKNAEPVESAPETIVKAANDAAPADTDYSRNAHQQAEAAHQEHSGRYVQRNDVDALVYQVLNKHEDVVAQYPAEETLNLRRYVEELETQQAKKAQTPSVESFVA